MRDKLIVCFASFASLALSCSQADSVSANTQLNGLQAVDGFNYKYIGPLVVWNEKPATEAYVVWGFRQYLGRGYRHTISYSEDKNFKHSVQTRESSNSNAVTARALKLGSCDKELSLFKGKLRGLKPNTTYYVRVKSHTFVSPVFHFKTAPAPSDEFSEFMLFSGGDSRSDQRQRRAMNSIMGQILERDPKYYALIHGGDFVGSGSRCSHWRYWMGDHQFSRTSKGRVLPVIPTIGNHEASGKDKFAEIWGNPQGNQKFYYSNKIGPLSIVILDSETSTEGRQLHFLREALDNAFASPFIIAGYHRAAWPAVKSPARTKTFIPTFEKHGVNLVMESDGHALKQTCPIRNNRCRSDGVVYVGEGGLGVPQRRVNRGRSWYLRQYGGYAISRHHIQSIEVKQRPLRLVYKVYYDGRFRREITMRPRGSNVNVVLE